MADSKTVHWFPWDFIAVTFGFAWIFWLPGVLETQGLLRLPVPWNAFFLMGIFGPLAGALYATARRGGWPAIRRFLTRVLDVRLGLNWWLVILIFPLIPPALALWIQGLLESSGAAPPVLANPWMILPTILFMTVLGGGQEEFGWRGYALDILQSRWSALTASVVLGLIWGLWHLPLFFIQHTGQYYMPLWAFVLASPAFSILTTWIYNSTGKRLFAALLFHGVINAGLETFPPIQKVAGADQLAFYIVCGLYWLCALFIVALFGGRHLSRQSSEKNV